MAIPQECIDEVRARASFVELASDVVVLKRAGKNFSGLCPFHSEKTPSFQINEEEGLFYCFGCGEKGSIFDFIMKTRGFTFPEAVRYLAAKVGVRVPEESLRSRAQGDSRRKRTKLLREVMIAAQKSYQDALLNPQSGALARGYLQARGVCAETIDTFALGFAPESWSYIEDDIAKRLKSDSDISDIDDHTLRSALVEMGLIKKREASAENDASSYFDLLRKRLIFPISRSDGVPIGFGARLIENRAKAPKYLNSSESPLYAKRRSFYGLIQALPEIRRLHHVFLVEGYLDVISMHQIGLSASLATCGTAVTAEHAQVLSRIANRVTIVFDGDSAGRKAAAHSFEVFINSGIDLSAVVLDEGDDPDSLAQRLSKKEYIAVLKRGRRPITDLYIDYLKEECGAIKQDGLSTVIAGKVASRYASVIAKVINPVERELRIRQGSEYLGVSEQALLSMLREKFETKPTEWTSVRKRESVSMPLGNEVISEAEVPLEDPRFTEGSRASDASQAVASKAEGKSEKYYQQIIIALLCEPRLAQTLNEMRCVYEEEVALRAFPDNVKAFIEEVRKGSYVGVADLFHKSGSDDLGSDPQFDAWRDVLLRNGLNGSFLLAEAIRQSRIGGGKPKILVEEAGREASRRSLKEDVENIRLQESAESDVGRLEQLAQEKLRKKRSLERLREQD